MAESLREKKFSNKDKEEDIESQISLLSDQKNLNYIKEASVVAYENLIKLFNSYQREITPSGTWVDYLNSYDGIEIEVVFKIIETAYQNKIASSEIINKILLATAEVAYNLPKERNEILLKILENKNTVFSVMYFILLKIENSDWHDKNVLLISIIKNLNTRVEKENIHKLLLYFVKAVYTLPRMQQLKTILEILKIDNISKHILVEISKKVSQKTYYSSEYILIAIINNLNKKIINNEINFKNKIDRKCVNEIFENITHAIDFFSGNYKNGMLLKFMDVNDINEYFLYYIITQSIEIFNSGITDILSKFLEKIEETDNIPPENVERLLNDMILKALIPGIKKRKIKTHNANMLLIKILNIKKINLAILKLVLDESFKLFKNNNNSIDIDEIFLTALDNIGEKSISEIYEIHQILNRITIISEEYDHIGNILGGKAILKIAQNKKASSSILVQIIELLKNKSGNVYAEIDILGTVIKNVEENEVLPPEKTQKILELAIFTACKLYNSNSKQQIAEIFLKLVENKKTDGFILNCIHKKLIIPKFEFGFNGIKEYFFNTKLDFYNLEEILRKMAEKSKSIAQKILNNNFKDYDCEELKFNFIKMKINEFYDSKKRQENRDFYVIADSQVIKANKDINKNASMPDSSTLNMGWCKKPLSAETDKNDRRLSFFFEKGI